MDECQVCSIFSKLTSYWKEDALLDTPQFRDNFRIEKEIGRGAYAVVNQCYSYDDKNKYAVKIVNKRKLNDCDKESLKHEISILKNLHHPRIMKFYSYFEDFSTVYLVTELLPGGELFDRIIKKRKYSEKQTIEIVKNLLQAVTYIHDQSIVHRDIKPENILLSHKSNDTDVKLCDFGLATFVNGENRTTFCGSASYIASEIVWYKSYGTKVDLWSVGVNIFTLLSGKLPFVDRNTLSLFKKIRRGHFEFNEDDWKHVSHDAKDFVSSLLQVDPSKRPNAADLLESKWLQGS